MLEVSAPAPRVVVLRLNRPERRNAVDTAAVDALASAVWTAYDDGARAIVLAGNGPHFCAGADLKAGEPLEFATHLRTALDALHEVPCVTIAAVHGAALGAGMQLAIACDLRVATAGARFGIPAARLGLMVDQWTVQRVVALCGAGPARAVLLAAEEITDPAARSIGLVSRAGDLAEALAWAAEIAELAPLTIAGHKLALHHLEPAAHDVEVETAFRRAWASEDLVEGRAAFAEKRPPKFLGR